MKNDNHPQHTKGELQLGGVDYMGGFYEVIIHYADGKVFGDGRGKTPKEAEANAHRIIKAVNMHDELIEELTRVQVTYRDLSEKFASDGDKKRADIYEKESLKLKKLLKQSEQQ